MRNHDIQTSGAMRHPAAPRPAARWIACAAGLAALFAACDTDVTNPGPTEDDFLNRPDAHPAIVTGVRRALADAMDQILYWTAAVSFEINPAGSTGSFGIPPLVQGGTLSDNLTDDWNDANVARFTAEDAVRRFRSVLSAEQFASSSLVAQAYVYAGYANRLLGENFCGAVIPIETADGTLAPGDSTAHTDYFMRAERHFTEALNMAAGITGVHDTVKARIQQSARAGRASVRANLATYGLASWSDAVADAAGVPDAFRFFLPYFTQDPGQYNYIHFANGDEPYRAHTQWGTFYESYYPDTNDPRVPWDSTSRTGDAAVAKFGGNVPWFPQQKYDSRSSPINVASGWEMRLIEAEAALAGGDFTTALGKINARRMSLGLTPATATTLEEGWTALKLERQLELWLEARRLGDLRRWADNNIPGATADGHYRDAAGNVQATPVETMTSPVQRSMCYPIGDSERDTNPNIP